LFQTDRQQTTSKSLQLALDATAWCRKISVRFAARCPLSELELALAVVAAV
jgi:hypothetical protein